MAQRKSVKLSTRPVHAAEATRGLSALGGNFISSDEAETREAGARSTGSDYGLLAQAVYGTVYALSFGCVFSAILVSRFLPGQEIVARGIGNGARAAHRVAAGFGKKSGGPAGFDPDPRSRAESLRPA